MSPDAVELTDSVSQTLFIPLWARAQEFGRRDGILRDRVAARLVATLPKRLFDFPKRKPMIVGSAVRARYFDDIAVAALSVRPEPVLVHIGCGLDDRFGRTDRGKGIQVNIDLPQVMALREKLMPAESERNIDWTGSLLEAGWMDRLRESWPGASFVFFMEGLLMYFAEDDVRGLFVNLAERFAGASLHFDVCSSHMCKVIGGQEAIRQTNAAFKWGIDDDCALEKWESALRYDKTAYYFDRFKKRWGLMSLMRFVPRFGKGSRMLSYRVEKG